MMVNDHQGILKMNVFWLEFCCSEVQSEYEAFSVSVFSSMWRHTFVFLRPDWLPATEYYRTKSTGARRGQTRSDVCSHETINNWECLFCRSIDRESLDSPPPSANQSAAFQVFTGRTAVRFTQFCLCHFNDVLRVSRSLAANQTLVLVFRAERINQQINQNAAGKTIHDYSESF